MKQLYIYLACLVVTLERSYLDFNKIFFFHIVKYSHYVRRLNICRHLKILRFIWSTLPGQDVTSCCRTTEIIWKKTHTYIPREILKIIFHQMMKPIAFNNEERLSSVRTNTRLLMLIGCLGSRLLYLDLSNDCSHWTLLFHELNQLSIWRKIWILYIAEV